jgi:hypothetical protein
MNYYDALKLSSLQAIIKPDIEAYYRHIFRWYSKNFHTPLHIVETLAEEDVLIAYYESAYEELSEEAREDLMTELTETEESKKKKIKIKDLEDYEDFCFARQIAEEVKQQKSKEKLKDIKVFEKPTMFNAFKSDLQLVSAAMEKVAFDKLEPDVSIKFVDAESFEKEIERLEGSIPEK